MLCQHFSKIPSCLFFIFQVFFSEAARQKFFFCQNDQMINENAVEPGQHYKNIQRADHGCQGEQIKSEIHGVPADSVQAVSFKNRCVGWQTQSRRTTQIENADNTEYKPDGTNSQGDVLVVIKRIKINNYDIEPPQYKCDPGQIADCFSGEKQEGIYGWFADDVHARLCFMLL
ncbi:hypothetical protein SDC9_65160 [bioreactor metagenome]|uniref:Uncharacterized protein n=1 Tax=bioreactor metagenome TaxID=1076179 RepID=A0A644XRJ0_9ZZZZ